MADVRKEGAEEGERKDPHTHTSRKSTSATWMCQHVDMGFAGRLMSCHDGDGQLAMGNLMAAAIGQQA
jgi:hypothetical protein